MSPSKSRLCGMKMYMHWAVTVMVKESCSSTLFANNDWSAFSIVSSIYASGSVLTTYRSKLLLISGKDMTVWEFSGNDFVFEPSYVEPIPSTYLPHYFTDLNVISKDEYLIVFYNVGSRLRLSLFQLIYDGRNWKLRKHEDIRLCSNKTYLMTIDSHTIVIFELLNEFYRRRYRSDYDISDYYDIVGRHKAPMLSFDDGEDTSINWEKLEVISCAEFSALLYRGKFSTILHNQQLYFVDSQGVIFISFIQPTIVPIVWGNSGVIFQQAPHLVGLSDGTLLMIGMVEHRHGSQLDVIKVTQKGGKLAPIIT